MERDFDLIALGGGLAGLVAAARAAELGLKAAVLEAAAEERYLCNSRAAGGVLHAAYQDVTRGHAHLAEVIGLSADGDARADQVQTISAHAERTLDWLKLQGVRFVRAANFIPGAWVFAPPRRPVTHLEWQGFGSDVALRVLNERLRERSGRLYLNTRARALHMQGGACHGLIAETPEGTITLTARAVVLADGGFSGNPDLFRQYIGPRPDRVVQRGVGTGIGDGLRMAVTAGAATSDLSRFYGHLLSRDAFRNDKLWPYPQIDFLATAGIVVDASGRRLFDEGEGGVYAANYLATLDDPLCATVIVGTSTWDGPGARDGSIPANPQLERNGGTLFRADTIGALANAAGIDASGLRRSIDAYNQALSDKGLGRLDPPRSERKAPALPIDPPYIAIPISTGITYTMGGVLIDGDARVLATDGSSIEGLYAAGATTGGLEGGRHAAYVGGLIKAAVFGLRAAEHAAARAKP